MESLASLQKSEVIPDVPANTACPQFWTCEARCGAVGAFPGRDDKGPDGEGAQGVAGKGDCFGPVEITTNRRGNIQ